MDAPGELELQPIEVAFEATYGWELFADLLADAGIPVHMAHPLATKAISPARVKTDAVDAKALGPPAADQPVGRGLDRSRGGREARRLVRTRAGLVRIRSRGHAAARVAGVAGRSTSRPRSNRASARTSATRCGPLIARQRSCAASRSLKAGMRRSFPAGGNAGGSRTCCPGCTSRCHLQTRPTTSGIPREAFLVEPVRRQSVWVRPVENGPETVRTRRATKPG